MMNKQLTHSILSLGLLLLASAVAPAAESPRPNILLILADDLGYADVGFNGSTDITTPQLDRLAEGGTVFSSAYVVHPFCGPSRMGLFSGRYPHEFGGPFNLPDYSSGQFRDQGIPTSEILISNVLQDAGYQTGLMGKWHLGEQEEHHPNKRGFSEFYGFLGGGKLFFGPYQKNNPQGKVWDYKTFPEHNGVDDSTLTASDYMTDVLTVKGVEFIRESAKKDDPFFLMMSYNAPHTVLAATEEDLAKFPDLTGKRKVYAAMVYALDRGVGELVDALKASGEYDDTLIVFLSDNGGRTDEGANNSPLRGVKGDTLEGGYRVPMFIHWPGKVPAGGHYGHPVTALDFYPTFAGLAGAPIPDGKQLDGEDIWEDFIDGRSVRKGGMIYCVRHKNGYSDVGARRDEWKISRTGMGPWKLFNVEKDVSESRDLRAQYPERVQEMVAETEKWSRSHTQPLWFDSNQAKDEWTAAGMPKYDKLFEVK